MKKYKTAKSIEKKERHNVETRHVENHGALSGEAGAKHFLNTLSGKKHI